MPHQKPKVRLWAAAQNHDPAALQEALRAGAPVNAINDLGQTALMWAAQAYEGKAETLVDRLLAAGADPNLPGHARPPLILACDTLRPVPGVVEALLRAGADPDARDRHGHRAMLYLLQRHPDPAPSSSWSTETAASGVACVRLLVNAGASAEALNVDGETAQALAERHRYADRAWLAAWAVHREQQALRRAVQDEPVDDAVAPPRARL